MAYDYYYVNENEQTTGEHEVHKESCSYMAYVKNKKYLGNFDKCSDAIKKAKEYYSNVDGCYYCCNDCHKK